jgi:Fe2+ transport system protein FeoA
VRLDETLAVQPVRVRGKKGVAVFSGGMGLKTIVHIDKDDRRVPLLDMKPGETGHIVGATGGHEFVRALECLGFREKDPITLERKLPPMEYLTRMEHGTLLRLSEGDAAHILGEIGGEIRQFSLSSANTGFRVTQLLGGMKAITRLRKLGICEGIVLTLKEVRSKQTVEIGGEDQLMITSRDGLHLHLPKNAGQMIFVRLVD